MIFFSKGDDNLGIVSTQKGFERVVDLLTSKVQIIHGKCGSMQRVVSGMKFSFEESLIYF